jgi:hypothetical protein
MQLTVKVTPKAAAALKAGPPTGSKLPREAAELSQHAQRLGIQLQPAFPGIDDPELSTYFTAQVPPDRLPKEVQEQLLRLEGVEAAYAEAQAEPAGETGPGGADAAGGAGAAPAGLSPPGSPG